MNQLSELAHMNESELAEWFRSRRERNVVLSPDKPWVLSRGVPRALFASSEQELWFDFLAVVSDGSVITRDTTHGEIS